MTALELAKPPDFFSRYDAKVRRKNEEEMASSVVNVWIPSGREVGVAKIGV